MQKLLKKKQALSNKEDGFTIIEVVLVLAIAGLIFLIVFLALPQLQRSRRDTQRKNDVGRILAELENFSSNNSGEYPTMTGNVNNKKSVASFTDRYLSSADIDFKDPSGVDYTVVGNAGATFAPPVGTIQYATGKVCDGEGLVGGTARNVAVRMRLEAGDTYNCQDNK